MAKTDKKIENNLRLQFQRYTPGEDVPEELKREVFQTLSTFSLLGDIADLFTAKFGQTEFEMLDFFKKEGEGKG